MQKKQLANVILASVFPFMPMLAFGEINSSETVSANFAEIYNVTETDNLAPFKEVNNRKEHDNLSLSYSYTVPFEGDIDKSHQLAFDNLVNSLSNGAMSAEELNIEIDSLIKDENFTDSGLVVVFDEALINKLVTEGKIWVWNGLKEPLIGWIATDVWDESNINEQADVNDANYIQDNHVLKVLSSTNENEFAEALFSVGMENKIKFLLPVNDLDDISTINLTDILNKNVKAVRTASLRYSQGNALVGVFSKDTQNKLFFTYVVVNINNGEVALDGVVSGSTEEIVRNFYKDLKKHSRSLASIYTNNENNNEIIGLQTLENKIEVEKGQAKVLGNNHTSIWILNLNDENKLNEVLKTLSAHGVFAEQVKVESSKTKIDLVYKEDFNLQTMLDSLLFLQSTSNDFEFVYSETNVNNEQSDLLNKDISPANHIKNTYNKEKTENNHGLIEDKSKLVEPNKSSQTTQIVEPPKTKSIQRYLDPNKGLYTGGGVDN